MIRATVHYSGNVQGVGFRWTARRVADGYAVTGYVMNLPDGRVELIAEGEADEVDAMLKDLGGRMAHYIREAKVDRGAASGEFRDFEIRH